MLVTCPARAWCRWMLSYLISDRSCSCIGHANASHPNHTGIGKWPPPRAVDSRLKSRFGDSPLDSSLNPCRTRDSTRDVINSLYIITISLYKTNMMRLRTKITLWRDRVPGTRLLCHKMSRSKTHLHALLGIIWEVENGILGIRRGY